MAKIPVEKKRQSTWIWWLLGLVLIGGIIWILVDTPDDDDELVLTGVEEVETLPTQERQDYEGVDLGVILANPGEYVGESFPTMEVRVSSVPTDRGFWISDGDDSLFAIINDGPEERPKDVNPEQTLRLEGGTLHDSSYLPDVQGAPLDASTVDIINDQSIFLVVDESNIAILEEGVPQAGTASAPNAR